MKGSLSWFSFDTELILNDIQIHFNISFCVRLFCFWEALHKNIQKVLIIDTMFIVNINIILNAPHEELPL